MNFKFYAVVKRTFDIVASSMALLVSFQLNLD